MTTVDYQAMAEELRFRADTLRADLPTLSGDEAGAVRATLHWLDDCLTAIAIGDDDAITELVRQGEAASRLLHPERSHLN